MNKVVVTGATGHIGNVLVRQLSAIGNKVTVLIPPGEDLIPLNGLNVEMVVGDIRDREALLRCFTGTDMVYHLAGVISILPGKNKLLEDINVAGTRNVVEACLQAGVRRLIYTSSIHALKEPPHGTMITESQPFDPGNVLGDYAKSKARASLEVMRGIQQGLDAVIVCPTGVIGPYDFKVSEMGQLIKNFITGKQKIGVQGAYDFVDVRDVAAGIILAADRGHCGETYILSGEQIAIPDLFCLLKKITGIKIPGWNVPCWLARAAGVLATPFYLLRKTKPLFTAYSIDVLASNSLISSARARRELGYSPRSIAESIRDTVTWFKDESRRRCEAAGVNDA